MAPYSTIRLAMTLTYSPPRDRRKAVAAESRPPGPRRLAEDRVREAEHLAEVGVASRSSGARLARRARETARARRGDNLGQSKVTLHLHSMAGELLCSTVLPVYSPLFDQRELRRKQPCAFWWSPPDNQTPRRA